MIIRFFSFIIFSICASNVQAWDIFSPSSYEECSERAARNAKTRDALGVLLQACNKEFPARKGKDGKYYYYSSKADAYIQVSGPKLSENDLSIIETVEKLKIEADIKAQEADIKAQEADIKAQEADIKAQEANLKAQNEYASSIKDTFSKLRLTRREFECDRIGNSCYVKSATITIENNSKNTITAIGLGFTIINGANGECSKNLAENIFKKIRIPPGESGTISVGRYNLYDIPHLDGAVVGCFSATSVEIEH